MADYVTGAGLAEGLAQGETSFLVMMATDTLVLSTPRFDFTGREKLWCLPGAPETAWIRIQRSNR